MKKTTFMVLVMILTLMVTACGKKTDADNGASANGNSSSIEAAAGNEAAAGQINNKNDEVACGTEGEIVVFTTSLEFKLEDSSAWLGVIPTGTKYEKEADADDVDMLYSYVANFEDEKKTGYRFEFDSEYFFGIGDGTYDMVLNSSDDGAIGKVLLQFGIEIKGEEIILDFDNKK